MGSCFGFCSPNRGPVGFLVATPGVKEARRVGGMAGESTTLSTEELGDRTTASTGLEFAFSLIADRAKSDEFWAEKRLNKSDLLFLGLPAGGEELREPSDVVGDLSNCLII